MAFRWRFLQPSTLYGVSRSILVNSSETDGKPRDGCPLFQEAQTTKPSPQTTLVTYSTYNLKDPSKELDDTDTSKEAKVAAPYVSTNKGAALIKMINNPVSGGANGTSHFELTTQSLDYDTALTLSDDAEQCIALVKDIEKNVTLVKAMTDARKNNASPKYITGHSTTVSPKLQTFRALEEVHAPKIIKELEYSDSGITSEILRDHTSASNDVQNRRGSKDALLNFDLIPMNSPPPARNLTKSSAQGSWWSCVQSIPKSAAYLAKNKFQDIIRFYYPIEKKHTGQGDSPQKSPDSVMTVLSTDSKLRDVTTRKVKPKSKSTPKTVSGDGQQTNAPSPLTKPLKQTTPPEKPTPPIQRNMSSPPRSYMSSPPRSHMSSPSPRLVMKSPGKSKKYPVRIVHTDMSEADQSKAVNIVERVTVMADGLDPKLTVLLKSQFQMTFGGKWLTEYGGDEMKKNIKKIYSESASYQGLTKAQATIVHIAEEPTWHLLKEIGDRSNGRSRKTVYAIELVEHALFKIGKTKLLLYRDVGTQSNRPKPLSNKTVIVKQTTMSMDMQLFCVQCARCAMERRQSDDTFSVAEFITKMLNEKYGKRWHCVVGPEIHEALVHNNKSHLFFFQYGFVDLLLWKT